MRKPFIIRCSLVASLLILLGNCGWHLRGLQAPTVADENREEAIVSQQEEGSRPANSPAEPNRKKTSGSKTQASVKLVLKQRNNALTTAIKRTAWENNYAFSETGTKYLLIENESLEKRPLSVTETGIAAQYQLILTISFSQRNANGDFVLPTQKMVSWRSYDFDAKLIIAKSQEEEALIAEMREELAQRIISALK